MPPVKTLLFLHLQVRRIKGREVEDMKQGLTSLSKVDEARARGVSTQVAEIVDQVEGMDSALSSQEEQCKRLVDLWSVYEQSYEELETIANDNMSVLANHKPATTHEGAQARLEQIQVRVRLTR